MNWIVEHSWIIPLAITVLAWSVVVFGMATAETGEDIMSVAPIFGFTVMVTIVVWAAWAVIRLLIWLI